MSTTSQPITAASPTNSRVKCRGASIFYAPQKGEGRIRVPGASTEEIERLTQACDPATFGRGQQDVFDESYRKPWKLDTENFACQFALPYSLCADIAELMLGDLADTFILEFELYKLNVYGPGSFFKAHVDTPRQVNMIGSLVIVLPTEHEGGELTLRHGGVERTISSANMVSLDPSSPAAAFVAFYGDTEHEVLPVTSGYRLTLTYNLYKTAKPIKHNRDIGPASGVRADALKANIKAIINNPRFLPKRGFFGFHLAHSCVARMHPASKSGAVDDFITSLKGDDAVLYRVLRVDLKLSCSFQVLSGIDFEDYRIDFEPYPAELASGISIAFDTLTTHFSIVDEEYDKYLIDRVDGTFVWDAGTGDGAIPLHRGEYEFQPVVWVGEPHPLNKTRLDYHAYGNEHRTDTLYQRVCLVVEITREA